MPIEQKSSKIVVKTESGLVQVLPETSIAAVDGLSTELAGVVHNTGTETVDGVKSFSKNTMTEAIALSGSSIDVSTGSFFTKTISADTTFTFTGVPAGKTCMFTLILTNGGAYNITFPGSVTWAGGTSPTLKSVGTDFLTFITTNGGTTWSEISGGSGGAGISDSGVSAGSYGPSSNETPTYGNTFTVPQITVNQKGQVTAAVNKTVTIPASDNTDTKVDVTLVTQTRGYLLATTTTPTGTATSVSAIADSGVYLTENPGTLHASSFEGTALRATNDVDDNPIKTTYAKLASPALTGTPTAPTAASGTSTTQIATTEFVQNAVNFYSENVVAVSSSEIDLSLGRAFTKTVDSDTTFTISNVPAGKMTVFMIGLTNGGAFNVAWPASVSWNGGNLPSFPATGLSVVQFITFDGGTHWHANVIFT